MSDLVERLRAELWSEHIALAPGESRVAALLREAAARISELEAELAEARAAVAASGARYQELAEALDEGVKE